MAPFLRQVPARRMARMLRHQIVRKKRMKHDKTEWPTAPATPRSTSERYSWYVLGILTLSQTCHGIDRAIIGLVLAPVGKEFGLSAGELGFLAGFAYGIFFAIAAQHGRASCRERVSQSVEIPVVAVALENKEIRQ